MTSSGQQQCSSTSDRTERKARQQRLNSMTYGDIQGRSSVGSQLPEDFFEYLDRRDLRRGRDRLLARLGKRLVARFRGDKDRRQQLRTNRSNVTVLDSEIDSNLWTGVLASPKRAISLLSIHSFRRSQRTYPAQVTSNKAHPYMKDLGTAHLAFPPNDDATGDDLLNGQGTVLIELKKEKESGGFGFNVVGGIDDEHIPGDPGIFVSKIRPNSVAARDKRLKIGDRIVSVNGIPLTGKTHDEAVRILRSTEGSGVFMIEQDAESRALNKPTDLTGVSSSDESTSSSKTAEVHLSPQRLPRESSNLVNTDGSQNMSASVEVEQKGIALLPLNEVAYLAADKTQINGYAYNEYADATLEERQIEGDETEFERMPSVSTASPFTPPENSVTEVPEQGSEEKVLLNGDNGDDINDDDDGYDEDEEDDHSSVVSYDARYVLDDIPRTPKRPHRLFDPLNASIFNEVMAVTAGVAALGIGIYVGYQFLKRRSIV